MVRQGFLCTFPSESQRKVNYISVEQSTGMLVYMLLSAAATQLRKSLQFYFKIKTHMWEIVILEAWGLDV